MKNRLPLNNLYTFAFAAEQLSFQKAAEELYVTPSAVSHQIRNLEEVLGYKLFSRSDKGVSLTLQGEKLFADIRLPIKQLQEANRAALHGFQENTLSLSIAPIFATRWLLPRLKDFYNRYPEIKLTVIATPNLVDFDSDPFDAAIRMGKGSWDQTTSYRLFNKEIVAVCHPALIKPNGKLFTPNEIHEFQLIQNSAMPSIWDEWFESAGIKVPPTGSRKFQAQNSSQVIEALQSGDSIGLIDRNFIKKDIESGRLALACDFVLLGKDGYFLTAPKPAEILPSFLSFKDWIFTQLRV